ncbi:MAG: cysteine hydrolase [Clostridiales bacterium]|nr:cysteine hydrolase [Clostridiales bacterium]
MPINLEKFQSWFTDGPYLTRVKPESSALLIVDMTYICCDREYGVGAILKAKGAEAAGEYFYDRIDSLLIPNQNKLAAFFREKGIPVIYLTFSSARKDARDLYPLGLIADMESKRHETDLFSAKNAGIDIMGIVGGLDVLEGDMAINKLSSGAFYTSNLDATLRNMGIKTLFFAGVCTNMCVESTAREAVDRGYNAIIIEDACATYKKEWQEATCEIFEMIFGAVLTADEVMSEYPWDKWPGYDL